MRRRKEREGERPLWPGGTGHDSMYLQPKGRNGSSPSGGDLSEAILGSCCGCTASMGASLRVREACAEVPPSSFVVKSWDYCNGSFRDNSLSRARRIWQ